MALCIQTGKPLLDRLDFLQFLVPSPLQFARGKPIASINRVVLFDAKPGEGLPLAEEALTIALSAVGEASRDTALMYGNVAEIHRFTGRPERAIPLFRKARAIYERMGDADTPRFASLLSEEGLALMDDGQLALAEQEMLHATRVLAGCSSCGMSLAVAESNLGALRLRQRKYTEAEASLTHALGLERQYSVRPGYEMADTLRILSQVRDKQRRHQDATELRERAAAITG